ncbi:hypothetical protein [Desertihabitans aurantiacus]|uniref:hypothetical protein n=1 Tax=Desertihabitans aurantiacus TaxID=2282477 RepID=UPI000DF7907B|nr:hypothetical protein [Desertihabitans aurantiacus]
MSRAPLAERVSRRLLAVAVAVGAVMVTALLLWSQAAAWGLPYASFTDEHGSRCTTTWLGHECEPTLDHVEAVLGFELPAGAVVEEGHYTETHDIQLSALVRYPLELDDQVIAALDESYGPCQRVPSPLPPDHRWHCVRSDIGFRVEGQLPPYRWRMATAVPPESDQVVLDVELRSR